MKALGEILNSTVNPSAIKTSDGGYMLETGEYSISIRSDCRERRKRPQFAAA